MHIHAKLCLMAATRKETRLISIGSQSKKNFVVVVIGVVVVVVHVVLVVIPVVDPKNILIWVRIRLSIDMLLMML